MAPAAKRPGYPANIQKKEKSDGKVQRDFPVNQTLGGQVRRGGTRQEHGLLKYGNAMRAWSQGVMVRLEVA